MRVIACIIYMKFNMKAKKLGFIFLFISFFRFAEFAYTQCTNTDYAGVIDPGTRTEKYNNKVGWGFLIRLPDFTFTCCGVIRKWEIHVEEAGELQLQVWRNSDSLEQLVGENVVNSTIGTVANELSFDIGVSEQITVIPGDAIGWRTPGVEVITYEDINTEDKMIYHDEAMPYVQVGRTHIYQKNDIKNRMYAVKTYLAPGTAPSLNNLPASVTIGSDMYPGATVFTPTFSDINTHDSHNFTHAGTLPSYFIIDSTTGDVKVAKDLLPATFKIYLVINDICGLQDIGQLTVTVVGPNQPPKLENMPGIGHVHEDVTIETLVYNLTVTDSDPVTCEIIDTVPAELPFILKIHQTQSDIINSTVYYTYDFGIYLKGGENISYSQQPAYELNVTCYDGSLWSSDVIYVYVQRNNPPVFSNLPGNISISARSLSIGSPFYDVIAHDTEDTVQYNMTCSPSNCPFALSSSGRLFATESLLQNNIAIYDMYIYVTDGRHLTGPEILTVIIIDRNNPPVVSSIPAVLYVDENTPEMTVLVKFTITDADVIDSISCFYDVQPVLGLTLFSFNDTAFTLSVKSGVLLDFETLIVKIFNVTFTITDDIDYIYQSIVINILNVNEAPRFVTSKIYVTVNEAQNGAYITTSPSLIDDDIGDTVVYGIKSGSGVGYININESNGVISFAVDYDIDSNLPMNLIVEIEITDSGGLTDTCSVDISVNDVNDNTPVFNSSSYTFTPTTSDGVGTVIGTVHATDADKSTDNSLIAYNIDHTSVFKDLFIISSDGMILALVPMSNFSVGQLLNFKVIASDNGAPQLSSEVVVSIIIKTGNTSSVTFLAVATETGNSPDTTEVLNTLEWRIVAVAATIGVILSMILIGCQIHQLRRHKNKKDFSPHISEQEKVPKPLPSLHRMKSTTLLLDDNDFFKNGADGNEHPPLRRSMSHKNFTHNLLRSSQSKVSDLASVSEDCQNVPRIIRTSGIQQSRDNRFFNERASLRF